MPLPTFEDFYTALHAGRAPFPWQARLARDVIQGGWPELLDLPTGVGKTTALEIALYALAARPDAMPRRTLLVVDRRVVVNQGAMHAREILERMSNVRSGPVAAVATALRALHGARDEDPSFVVGVMRGGMPRDNDWAARPDVPVLGVSTVDQVGSRLLFRGYGIRPRSLSIHAGLLGNDTLILLDEVHLSEPFAQTLAAVSRYQEGSAGETILPRRFLVVQMSATAATADRTPFRLGRDDRAHPVLARRLSARKAARLVSVKVTGKEEAAKLAVVADRVAKQALDLQDAGSAVVCVVVNRVDTARLAHRRLKESGAAAILVTGRMRPIDRDRLVREDLLPNARSGRDRQEAKPLIVVATQCIEAGADFDFDALVTECASLDALLQRFGRVDRLGELGSSTSVVVCRSDQQALDSEDPVYGTALAATWNRLQEVAADDIVNFGIGARDAITPPDREWTHLMAPRTDAPVLLPMHLDLWSQTSQRLPADPDVSWWLHGGDRTSADVQLIWRTGIARPAPDGPSADGVEIDESKDVLAWLEACRPSSLEAISVPIGVARKWLSGANDSATLADVVVASSEEQEERGTRRGTESSVMVAWRWEGDESTPVTARQIRPGDVLIVDARRGGISAGTFDPNATDEITDVGDLAQLRGRGRASLRLVPDALKAWGIDPSVLDGLKSSREVEALTQREHRELLRSLLALLPESPHVGASASPAEYVLVKRALSRALARAHGGVEVVTNRVVLSAKLTPAERLSEIEDASTEDESSSFALRDVSLSAHCKAVRSVVTAFGANIGLPPAVVTDLALAAHLHDVGKADPRFQMWLVGGSEVSAAMLDEPLAKSALPVTTTAERELARRRAGYPRGHRHELLSLAMSDSNASVVDGARDPDLVLHLIASHHGWARPFAPAVKDERPVEVTLVHGGLTLQASSSHGRESLDSGVADRFWALTERYGWWGLAWLESILRLADHRASAGAEGGDA